jgi:transposase-like protein
MFLLAFGFFDSETKENWIWFMKQLSKAIGHLDNLAICTDACKGLEAAVAQVWPHYEKRECFRHLMDNLKKYYTGEVYAKNMWPAARTYTPHKFKYFFDKVVEASPNILKWLEEHHNLLWARSKFSTEIKCDYINNNLVESWNTWIKEHKDLPLHFLADVIREKTLTLFARRRISIALSPGILPAVIHQLNAASKGLGAPETDQGSSRESRSNRNLQG